MVKTRGAHRRSVSAKRSYRRRVRNSRCRGKGPAVCRAAPGCKRASGRKRSYCRKTRNTKRRSHGGSKKSHKRRNHRGRGILSTALVPFGLLGAKHTYTKRKK